MILLYSGRSPLTSTHSQWELYLYCCSTEPSYYTTVVLTKSYGTYTAILGGVDVALCCAGSEEKKGTVLLCVL